MAKNQIGYNSKLMLQEKIRKIDELIVEIGGQRMTIHLQQKLSNLKNTKIVLQNLLNSKDK